jgi:hypothetical protein
MSSSSLKALLLCGSGVGPLEPNWAGVLRALPKDAGGGKCVEASTGAAELNPARRSSPGGDCMRRAEVVSNPAKGLLIVLDKLELPERFEAGRCRLLAGSGVLFPPPMLSRNCESLPPN